MSSDGSFESAEGGVDTGLHVGEEENQVLHDLFELSTVVELLEVENHSRVMDVGVCAWQEALQTQSAQNKSVTTMTSRVLTVN